MNKKIYFRKSLLDEPRTIQEQIDAARENDSSYTQPEKIVDPVGKVGRLKVEVDVNRSSLKQYRELIFRLRP